MAGKRFGTVWAAVATALLVALIFGCGGSGSGTGVGTTGTPPPTGDAAVRSSSIGSYQSLGAGVAFPFTSLIASAPAGSALHNLGAARRNLRPTSLQFVPELDLYTDGGVSTTGGITFHYFTDAAGKDSAGTMALTIPGGSTSYATYPVTVNVAVNVTGGNLPCKGSAVLVFAGATGTNTLKGTLNLTRNSETVTVNMTLSPTLQVGGTLTIVENNTTISAVNLNGNLGGNIALNFTLQPQGYSGTGTINLFNLSMSLQFSNPSKASTSVNSSGDLVIDYPDGTTETVQNPFTAVLLLSGTTTTTTSGPTTTTTTTTTSTTGGATYTAAPVPGSPTLIASVSSSGQMVGQIAGSTWSYWSSPTAAPEPINLGSGLTAANVTSMAVNSKGHIAALGLVNNFATVLYWTSYKVAPAQVPGNLDSTDDVGTVAINDNDEIVASLTGGGSDVWATPTSPVATLPGGQVSGISNTGVAVGYQSPGTGNGGPNPPCIVWKQTVPPSTPQTLSPYSGGLVSIGANGTIAEWIADQLLVYSGPSYSKGVALPSAPGLTFSINQLLGVGPTGHILGYVYNGEPLYGAVWDTPTSDPINLVKSGAPNILGVFYETTGGLLIGANQISAFSNPKYSVLTPK